MTMSQNEFKQAGETFNQVLENLDKIISELQDFINNKPSSLGERIAYKLFSNEKYKTKAKALLESLLRLKEFLETL